MNTLRLLPVAFLTAMLTAGCPFPGIPFLPTGGGSTPPASLNPGGTVPTGTTTTGDYTEIFPMREGAAWVYGYEIVKEVPGSGKVSQNGKVTLDLFKVTTGASAIDGTLDYKDTNESTGTVGTVEIQFGLDKTNNTFTSAPTGGINPDLFLSPEKIPLPMKVGNKWNYILSGTSLRVNATVEATESITVTAGTFQAYKVVYSSTTLNGSAGAGSIEITKWFAKDVGLVKMIYDQVAADGIKTLITYQLRSR